MTSEYHGIFGKVAAVNKNDEWQPKCDVDKEFHPHQFLNKLLIPECTLPPMEAIFDDGSAEGYFEAVLLALFLQALPYTCFEQDHWSLITNTIPNNFEENWDCQVALADWTPRYTKNTITALSRKVENGIGASDGNRYGETRKCCVFTQSSVLVAVQKK